MNGLRISPSKYLRVTVCSIGGLTLVFIVTLIIHHYYWSANNNRRLHYGENVNQYSQAEVLDFSKTLVAKWRQNNYSFRAARLPNGKIHGYARGDLDILMQLLRCENQLPEVILASSDALLGIQYCDMPAFDKAKMANEIIDLIKRMCDKNINGAKSRLLLALGKILGGNKKNLNGDAHDSQRQAVAGFLRKFVDEERAAIVAFSAAYSLMKIQRLENAERNMLIAMETDRKKMREMFAIKADALVRFTDAGRVLAGILGPTIRHSIYTSYAGFDARHAFNVATRSENSHEEDSRAQMRIYYLYFEPTPKTWTPF